MSELQVPDREQQLVNELFDAGSKYWTELYSQCGVFAAIHRERQAIALQFFDELRLPDSSHILEVGCGAGWTSVALARRGFAVEAMDSVQSMVELVRKHAREAGVDDRVHASVGDVHDLSYPDSSFDVILAMGVTPWLHDLRRGLDEMVRVLAPGGRIILNADNRNRLNHLLDPLMMPALSPAKWFAKRFLETARLRRPESAARPHMYSIGTFNRMLRGAGLVPVRRRILGFGPFTILGKRIMTDGFGARLHRRFQDYADRGFPIFRSTGSQYIVLASKVEDGVRIALSPASEHEPVSQ